LKGSSSLLLYLEGNLNGDRNSRKANEEEEKNIKRKGNYRVASSRVQLEMKENSDGKESYYSWDIFLYN
jgi:hypothetical protein